MQQKAAELYDINYPEEWEEPEVETCDFGFGDECVAPDLKGMNCCFECWLYLESTAGLGF